MKPTLLLILAFQLALPSLAQPWLKRLPPEKSRSELNFYDYKNAFDSYWAPYNVENGSYIENGHSVKAPGWKQFKRWEYMMAYRIDKSTGAFPEKSGLDITEEYFRTHSIPRSSFTASWISMGPSRSAGGYEGIGRINCVAFHPTDISTYWAGAASGGLWVTNNDGASWTCLTDNTDVLAVSDIVIPDDYAQSLTIYIATGDKDSYDNNSVGVLKSTDGGITWDKTGITFELKQRKFVNRLLIDPSDVSTLVAATSDGVYKTTDGGATWDHQLTDEVLIDLEFKPGNSQVLYGSSFDGEIFVSTGNGEAWTRTMLEVDADRTVLAVTPAQPTWVYAVAARGELEGIYKSTNSGASFTKVFDGETKNLLHWNASGNGSGGQGYYDLAIDVSPTDPNLLLVGGINTWRSYDGGQSWNIVNHFGGVGVQTVHADKHNLRFRSNGDLWECNDGGIYISKDQGTTWTDKTNGMAISQVYRLGVSATEQDEVIMGLQDNGSKLHTATGWRHVNGGDGMEAMIDHTNVNIQYSTTQGGSFYRTLDHWESARHVKPQDAGAGAWVTPFVMDPENPDVIYGGYNEIWKTMDRGDSWEQVSSIHASDKIRFMAIAPSDNKVIYAGQSDFLYKSTTGGMPFEKITGNIPNQTKALSSIAVKHDDPQTVWLAVSGFTAPGVFQSVDGGTTWTNISAGLPQIPVYTVVQNRQSGHEIQLFAGTELGVYYKKGEADWIPFSTGLPNVIVTELEMYYAKDPTLSKLRAATYGRGLWETRVEFESSPMEYVSSTAKQNDTTSIKPGLKDREILKIEIITTGDLEPIHVQSFTFSPEGSTNPENDISAAKLYYTGNVNGFLKNDLFGQFDSAPNGQFTITGDIELISGVNYFWLAYDVPTDARLGNVLDAQCLSFNIGTEMIPSSQSPEGHRMIDLTYCKAGATTIESEYISHVRIGSVDHESGKGENGYQDFTDQVVEMEIGKPSLIEVTNSAPHSTNELYIWIDWNQDGNFHLQDERVYASGPLGITTYSTAIIPPEGAKLDLTTMRIRLNDTNFGSNDMPCGNANLGEVEDYSIHLVKENITGVAPIDGQNKVSVFPNPVTHALNISFADVETGKVEVEFYAPHGITVLKKELRLIDGKTSFSTTGIHPGMYVMKIKSGSDVWFEKVVKQ